MMMKDLKKIKKGMHYKIMLIRNISWMKLNNFLMMMAKLKSWMVNAGVEDFKEANGHSQESILW